MFIIKVFNNKKKIYESINKNIVNITRYNLWMQKNVIHARNNFEVDGKKKVEC